MSFEPPRDELVQGKFPQIEKLTLLDKGGFKAVYRARIAGKTEAFKLIQLPKVEETEDAEAFRQSPACAVESEAGVRAVVNGCRIRYTGAIEVVTIY